MAYAVSRVCFSSLRFDKSRTCFERSKDSIAGGVNSHYRSFEQPHPLFFQSGKGSRMIDVDGNTFIDYILGRGPLIFGHSPPFLLNKVSQSVASGLLFGSQHVLEVDLAETVRDMIPCAEKVRFASSGTEAVQIALRIARAFTGRRLIVKFDGHYHGWSDSILFAASRDVPFSAVPMSAGIPEQVSGDVCVLPWNDHKAIADFFTCHGEKIAAVIAEPVMCNTNCILPAQGYLELLRSLTQSAGALLIFDEVITGFRLHTGGAQVLFGVTPDLATFAKAMAGGFPISMVAGRRDVMGVITSAKVMHAGTNNANVMSVAAALATMECLQDSSSDPIARLHKVGQSLIEGLRWINRRIQVGMIVQGYGPVFAVSFTKGAQVTDCRSHIKHADATLLQRFIVAMLHRGVRVGGVWFTSTAHTDQDVDATLAAAEAALSSLRQEL